MSLARSDHTFVRPNGATRVSARWKEGVQSPSNDDFLAVVMALAKRAAREDHAREATQCRQASSAVGETP